MNIEYSSSNVEYKYKVIFSNLIPIRIRFDIWESSWKVFFYLPDKLSKIDVKAKAGEKKKIADFADLYQHRK